MKRTRWNSTLSYDVDKARAWQRRGKPMSRGGRLNPFNRERRERTRGDHTYGAYHRWIGSLPCVLAGHDHECFPYDDGELVKGHHVVRAMKGRDYANEVPFCALAHANHDTLGRWTFARRYDVDLQAKARELARLWDELRAA